MVCTIPIVEFIPFLGSVAPFPLDLNREILDRTAHEKLACTTSACAVAVRNNLRACLFQVASFLRCPLPARRHQTHLHIFFQTRCAVLAQGQATVDLDSGGE